MLVEMTVTGTEIVQSRIPIPVVHKPVFGTFAMTRKLPLTLLALLG